MTIRRSLLFLASLALCASAAPGQQESRVYLRGGEPPIESDIGPLALEGVPVTLAGKRSLLGWDRVDHIEGPRAAEFEPFRSVAADLWRARFRIERADFAAAEPLLEPLADRFAMKSGPSAAVAHAGLLRCRVERGASISAVIPWLHYVAANDDTFAAGSVLTVGELGAVLIDPELGLAPELPPIWLDLPPTQALARATWPAAPSQEGAPQPGAAQQRALALADLYLASLRDELGQGAQLPRATGGVDAGLSLVREIVTARIGSDEQRTQARASLLERLKKPQSAWTRAWISAAVGRSLVREKTTEDKLLGVGFLLEIPATTAEASPNLTGIALAQAAATLAELGDLAGAQRLRQELITSCPGHPAIEWGPIRRIGAPKPAPQATPAPLPSGDPQ